MKKILKIILLSLILIVTVTAFGSKEEKVSKQMKNYLYEKYGEEFEVDRIGMRNDNDGKFYEARIYPKSIIGTPKEEDKYYYGSASIEVNVLGILSRGTGDDYSFVKRDDDVENYLLPKAKELFGDKIRMKVDVEHEKTGDGSWWGSYKSSSLKEMREDVEKNPKTARVVLELKIFVFDKIDNKEEEIARKKQLFEFLQYLRKEKLDKYLSVDCNFMDDIVLAPSFGEDRYILEDIEDKEEKREIENKLREEVKKLSEKEFLDNMNEILKSEFRYEYGHLGDKFIESFSLIRTLDYLKEVWPSDYSKLDTPEKLKKLEYTTYEDITYSQADEYLFKKGAE